MRFVSWDSVIVSNVWSLKIRILTEGKDVSVKLIFYSNLANLCWTFKILRSELTE